MLKRLDKLFDLFKYIVIYFLFTLFLLLNKTQNNLYFVFDLLPNLDVVFIFFIFIWFEQNIQFSKYNLFVFGLIIDTFNFLPLGLSSISLLFSYKIIKLLRNYFIVGDHFIYFLRDSSLFISMYLIIQWFIFSFYNNNFFPFGCIVFNIIKNIIFSNLLYLIYKKYIKDV